jgi:hypothetical protein
LGSPAEAIDGSRRTAWTWTLSAPDAGAVDAGLLLDLGRAVSLKSLTIVTGTPGMTIVVEGAKGPVPSTITAPGWIQLAWVKALKPTATVTLRHSATQLRHLLIWITHPPPGVDSGWLELNDVKVMTDSAETGAAH